MLQANSALETEYRRRVSRIHGELGIPEDYAKKRGLPLQIEASELQSIGSDMYGRERFLTHEAAVAWDKMQLAASEADVEIVMFSAFRSLEYQRDLIIKERQKNRSIEDILKVLAAPGYSEHHTGLAVDVTTTGVPPLKEEFETSEAFTWLVENAAAFGFRLSYPRGNSFGFIYEPWHWAFHPENVSG